MNGRLNNRGQGLMEYLILVCLISVAAIAMVSIVGQNIRARYANISSALKGKKGTESLIQADESSFELKGMEDFMESGLKPGTEGWPK